MPVRTTTDPTEILSSLEAALVVDPVGNTVLGTIATILHAGEGDGWCAVEAATGALAVRSEATTPVALTAGWPSPEALVDAVVEQGSVTAFTGPATAVDPVAESYARRVGVRADRMAQRLFRLDALTVPSVAGSSRPASDADRPLLVDWFTAFGIEARDRIADSAQAVDRALRWGRIWLWMNPAGRPVALAARRAASYGSARIGPVYTAPDERGHGYGTAVACAATQDVLEYHAIPVLFTDLSNPVSNAIYRRLGYRPVGDYAHVDLTAGESDDR